MAEATEDLTNLPLYSLLSGPLTAAIEAEQKAAYHTLRFIRDAGFSGSGERRRVRTVDFGYVRTRRGPDGEDEEVQVTLTIPFLLLVPIPSLEIDTLTVDFLAKLREVETIEDEESPERSKLASKYPFLAGRNRLRVRSTPRTKEETEKTTTSYDLSVRLEAQAQEPPEGIERLIDGLAGLVSEREQAPEEG